MHIHVAIISPAATAKLLQRATLSVSTQGPLHKHTTFPSRLEGAATEEVVKIPRVDPVLWPSNGFSGPLSQEQLHSFDREGYLMLPEGFFSMPLVNECREAMLATADLYQQSGKEMERAFKAETTIVVAEPGTNVTRSIFGIDRELANPVARLIRAKESITAAQQILQDEVYLHQSRVNFQPAFDGTGFLWHSDFETWHSEDGMPRMRAASLVVFLADNSPQNGALMLIPRSHKYFIPIHSLQGSKNWETSLAHSIYGLTPRQALKQMVEEEGIVYCEGKAGQGLMFDCNLIHGSHSNISPFSRINVYSVFNALSNSLQTPFNASGQRIEYLATRDPAWVKPATPL